MEGWPVQEAGPKKRRARSIDNQPKEHTLLGQRESRRGAQVHNQPGRRPVKIGLGRLNSRVPDY
ncbi:UNVERIFIED_CONTAM: hypothetical protein Sradi_2383600 [Sesamum radiatum]|uniref:Uncharacterized protein n=1 Tax=Sesamum radiatum TaxID=300843 RepID=A0AAW2T736_SESRA